MSETKSLSKRFSQITAESLGSKVRGDLHSGFNLRSLKSSVNGLSVFSSVSTLSQQQQNMFLQQTENQT